MKAYNLVFKVPIKASNEGSAVAAGYILFKELQLALSAGIVDEDIFDCPKIKETDCVNLMTVETA